jgi:hypothetical protein
LQRRGERADGKVAEEPGEGRGDHRRALRSFESLVAKDRQDWRWEVSRATEFQNGTEGDSGYLQSIAPPECLNGELGGRRNPPTGTTLGFDLSATSKTVGALLSTNIRTSWGIRTV